MPALAIVLQLEQFAVIEQEVDALAKAHFREVDDGVEPRRHFELDSGLMTFGSKIGNLRIYTARVNEALVGYCTWNVQYDVESKGLLIATQGAWYMAPGHGRLGLRLYKFTLDALRALGVRCVYPHHRLQGRGDIDRLGPWFQHLGAKPIKIEYSLWIGD